VYTTDSSDEEEDYDVGDDDFVHVAREQDFHKLRPEETESFCHWVDKTQLDTGLPQRMLQEYERRKANQPGKEPNKVRHCLGLPGVCACGGLLMWSRATPVSGHIFAVGTDGPRQEQPHQPTLRAAGHGAGPFAGARQLATDCGQSFSSARAHG
jgi:hypothetical protein